MCIREGLLPKYSNIKLHDATANNEPFTLEFRRSLIQRELTNATQKIDELEEEKVQILVTLQNDIPAEDLCKILKVVEDNTDKLDANCKQTMVKKLSNLYQGEIVLPEESTRYVNLSSYELSDNEKEFLNLGLNCHIQTPIDHYKKKVELEILYEDILNLQTSKVADVNPNIKEELRAEGTRVRGGREPSKILTPELRAAAKSLRENEGIVVRRADKSNGYVILDRDDYREKLRNVLSDGSKFRSITKNPCDDLKKKINALINQAIEANQDARKVLRPVVGDYSPGYIYGNVKTHKPGSKVRPIISQMTAPTYKTAKQLNNVIKKYLPPGYMLKSTTEFVHLLEGQSSEGNLYSLDVESLFTNVPVNRTIDIICERVYNHATISPPPIPKPVLKKLLTTCTTEVPFRDIDGKMYLQIDGVTMGSPLGPTFANFFMTEVETRALENIDDRPTVYCRYIDDIFLLCNEVTLQSLKSEMITISGLNFTYETSISDKLPFLNVLVQKNGDTFQTSVYRKPTDNGVCMNACGDTPNQYKASVIKGFLYRAKSICSDKKELLLEIQRSKQILINNGYSNREVDAEIRRFWKSSDRNVSRESDETTTHTLFYRNFMNCHYQKDEKVLKDLI